MVVKEKFVFSIPILVLVPSFYGALSWGCWLLLYQARLIQWNPASTTSMILFWQVEICFLLSLALLGPLYNFSLWREEKELQKRSNRQVRMVILILHLIGMAGMLKYVLDFSAALGGLGDFVYYLSHEAGRIRIEADTTTSVGFQITYFGWMAIGMTVYEYVRRTISGRWLILAFIQLLPNLLFIGRTRPMWILFTCLMIIVFYVRPQRITISKTIKFGLLAVAVSVGLFLGVGKWAGKIYGEELLGVSPLPPYAQTLYYYGTAGFAYFNEIAETEELESFEPVRTFYPFFELINRVGFGAAPPRQINEFYYVPFPTNVGTALEPFYRDGGLPFTLFGIVIFTIGVDLVGLLLLRMGTSLSVFAWANLCFVSLNAFFTPKINNSPIWLFCTIGFVSGLVASVRRRHLERHQSLSRITEVTIV